MHGADSCRLSHGIRCSRLYATREAHTMQIPYTWICPTARIASKIHAHTHTCRHLICICWCTRAHIVCIFHCFQCTWENVCCWKIYICSSSILCLDALKGFTSLRIQWRHKHWTINTNVERNTRYICMVWCAVVCVYQNGAAIGI